MRVDWLATGLRIGTRLTASSIIPPLPPPDDGEHPLKTYRRYHQLTQGKVAAAIGVNKGTISRIETRQLRPTLAVVERLVEFSDGALSADAFFPGGKK
jgi:DNA-binding XRE family transcriptional regulator